MERKSSGELQEHMLWTYYGLRVGLGAIGIALPIVVLLAGTALHDVWLEPSISDYYHTVPQKIYFTTRDLFVGGLLAASACLYLYKGFSNKENIALNLAGVFAVFVALLPTTAPNTAAGVVARLHATSAVLFFLCLAYVSLFRARDTLHLLPEEGRPRYLRMYRGTGIAMVVSPLAAVVLAFGFEKNSLTFWVETLGVCRSLPTGSSRRLKCGKAARRSARWMPNCSATSSRPCQGSEPVVSAMPGPPVPWKRLSRPCPR